MDPWQKTIMVSALLAAVGTGCKSSRGAGLHDADGELGTRHDLYADQAAWTGACPKGLDPSNPTQRQSPIVLDPAVFKAQGGGLKLEYRESAASLVDNGHTIQVVFDGAEQSLVFEGHSYTLRQFHFHRLSEHVVLAGAGERRSVMEVHLVHTRPALGPDDRSTVVVLGFFVEEGGENVALEHLWSKVPDGLGSDEAWPIDVGAMIPRGAQYLVYEGSLTTPPCDEVVIHAVSTTPMTMSARQIKRFSDVYARNHRVLQPAGEAAVRRYRTAREER